MCKTYCIRAAADLEALDNALDDGENADADKAIEDGDSTVPSVVKMALRTVCNSKRLCCKLNAIVEDANRMLGEAYLFANFHVRRLLESDVEVHLTTVAVSSKRKSKTDDPYVKVQLSKPTLPTIDRKFYYRCLLAVAITNCRPDTLGASIHASMQRFDALRPFGVAKVDARDYNQLIADLSITMATMATNHLLMNASRRVNSYLRWRHPALSEQHCNIVKAVVYQPCAELSTLFNPDSTNVEAAVTVAKDLRRFVTLPKVVKWAKDAHTLLPLYHAILVETEHAKQKERSLVGDQGAGQKRFRGKMFTLLPEKAGFTVSHVPVSSMMLLNILRKLKMASHTNDGRTLNARFYWERYFNLKLVETSSRRFANRIVTDGYAVGLLMDRRVSVLDTIGNVADVESVKAAYMASLQDEEPCKTLDISAVDPGFDDVVTLTRRDGSVSSFSSARYYHESKVFKSMRCTRQWNKETKAVTDGWDDHIAPSTDVNAIRHYLAIVPLLVHHRMTQKYRQMRFLRYINKHKAIHAIVETIAPTVKGRTTLVLFGDWKGGCQSAVSRRTAGPLVEVKKALKRRVDVMFRDVDEHMTSKRDHNTWTVLCNMKAVSVSKKRNADGTRRRTFGRIHKVLHCKNSFGWPLQAGLETTWNRDVNASKNIMMLGLFEVLGYARPLEFCRAPKVKATRKKPT